MAGLPQGIELSRQRVIAHVDLDCFYAQVEAQRNKGLQGLPLAVVQYDPFSSLRDLDPNANRLKGQDEKVGNSIIALSYEAKACGVTRQMSGIKARALCKDLHLVQVPVAHGKADLTIYREAGDKVAKILARQALCEKASIDEVYLDVTEEASRRLSLTPSGAPPCPGSMHGMHLMCPAHATGNLVDAATEWWSRSGDWCEHERLLAAGATVVWELREQVLEELGYTTSAGVSHYKILAKLGSGLHKPAQQTVVPAAAVMDLLRDLPLAKLRGCGGLFGQEVQEKLGITTAGELAAVPLARLERLWGTEKALWLQRLAHGVDSVDGGITPRLIPKSISCGKTFRGQNSLGSANLHAIRFWLGELGKEVQERAEEDKRSNRRIPQLLTVAFDFCLEEERDRVSRSCPLRRGCQAAVIADDAMALIRKWAVDKSPRWTIHSMSIQVSNFQDAPTASITRFFGAAQAASPKAAARRAASPTAAAPQAASPAAAQAASPTAAAPQAASPAAAQAASPTATVTQAASPAAAAAKAASSIAAQPASPAAAPAAAFTAHPISAVQQLGSSSSAPSVLCTSEQVSFAPRAGTAPSGTFLHQAAPAGGDHAGSGCTDAAVLTAARELQPGKEPSGAFLRQAAPAGGDYAGSGCTDAAVLTAARELQPEKELSGTFLHQAVPAAGDNAGSGCTGAAVPTAARELQLEEGPSVTFLHQAVPVEGQHAGSGCTGAAVPTVARRLQLEQGHKPEQQVLPAGAQDQGAHHHDDHHPPHLHPPHLHLPAHHDHDHHHSLHHDFHPPPPHHLHPSKLQQPQQPQPGLQGVLGQTCTGEGNKQHHQQQQQHRSISPSSARPQQHGWKRIRGAEVDCQVLAELPPDLQAEIQSSLIVQQPARRALSGSQYSGGSSKRGRGRDRGRATTTDGRGGKGKAPLKDLLSFFKVAQPQPAHEQT